MNQWQLATVVMAITDTPWGSRDGHGRHRVYTVAELDVLADFGWPWDGVTGRLAVDAPTCQHMIRTDISAVSRIDGAGVSSVTSSCVGLSGPGLPGREPVGTKHDSADVHDRLLRESVVANRRRGRPLRRANGRQEEMRRERD